jgi:CheY-like chemotaxis protein
MPNMDGYKVAELLILIETYFFDYMKRNCLESVTKAKRHCPIIAVTANSDETVKEKAEKVGIS